MSVFVGKGVAYPSGGRVGPYLTLELLKYLTLTQNKLVFVPVKVFMDSLKLDNKAGAWRSEST